MYSLKSVLITSIASLTSLLPIVGGATSDGIITSNIPPTVKLSPLSRSKLKPLNTIYIKPKPDTEGNTYAPCNCTYYAKMRRPDLPNSLGNADTWFIRAKALGYQTGYKPRVGAIGQVINQMHVVYVEHIKGDQVEISEWNYQGPCIKDFRWVAANTLEYIYE